MSVEDLKASKAFYELLGLEVMGGDGEHYEIMRNGTTIVGLFQGQAMGELARFDRHLLTFNPGWDHNAGNTDPFTDVRELAATLRAAGLDLTDDSTAESDSGPAHFVVMDPDGNPVLVDQHR